MWRFEDGEFTQPLPPDGELLIRPEGRGYALHVTRGGRPSMRFGRFDEINQAKDAARDLVLQLKFFRDLVGAAEPADVA
jgi:hypothetical protein